MSRYLLDTCAYSLMQAAHPETAAAVRKADVLALSAIVVGELLGGFRLGSQQRANETELRRFLREPFARLLPITDATAAHYARLWAALRSRGRPLPTNDLWIAAGALEHELTILTADRHFLDLAEVGVEFVG